MPNDLPLSIPLLSSHALINSPLKSGITNVLLPSPAPKVVPIAENKSAYVLLLIVAPLALIKPVGAVFWATYIIAPAGAAPAGPVGPVPPVDPVEPWRP